MSPHQRESTTDAGYDDQIMVLGSNNGPEVASQFVGSERTFEELVFFMN